MSIGKHKIFLTPDLGAESTVFGRIDQGRRELTVALRKDITIEKLAELVDLSAPSMYQWKSGRSKPTKESLERLAKLFTAAGLSRYTAKYLDYGEDELPSKAPAVRLK